MALEVREMITTPEEADNVFQFEPVARARLDGDTFHFLAGAADDEKTLRANHTAFDAFQIRVRRLVDVSHIDTAVSVLGQTLQSPIILAPVGLQQVMHPEGEVATARAAAARGHLMIAGTLSSVSIETISEARQEPVWFQLYPTPDRGVTRALLQKAEAAGCPVVVLTVDTPVMGNRESQRGFIRDKVMTSDVTFGNFTDIPYPGEITDLSMDWSMVEWLRANTRMRVVLKGIVTHEDARLCVEHGVDGIIVSNHGGRQEESNRGTIACLPEVVEAVEGRLPVLVDGGFRRGTDVFKALALGAKAICIGQPYVWGLAAFGQAGVERVLALLQEELVRIMQLAGTPSVADITSAFVAS